MSDAYDYISQLIAEAARAASDEQEKYLLNFFGSLENAQKYGHLYILEEYPAKVITDSTIDYFSEDPIHLKVEYSWRLRRKTPEELADSQEKHAL